jgi:uncharacterized protein YrrD
MRKGSDLIGKPVVALDIGEVIANVRDLIIDRSNHRLVGIIVDEASWFQEAAVIEIGNISDILPAALMADNREAIVNASQVPLIQQILDRDLVLSGTRLVTLEGIDLGTIVDVIFDEKTGKIDSYETLREQADDAPKLAYTPIPQPLIIGADFGVVPLDVMPRMTGTITTTADRVQLFVLEPPTHLVEQTNLSASDRVDLDTNYLG